MSGGSDDDHDGDGFSWGGDLNETDAPDETDGLNETHGPDETDDLNETHGIEADPFAELDAGDGFSEADGDPFERMEVDEVDVDGVWDALEEDAVDGGLGVDATFTEPDPHEPIDHVVDKRTYCHRCPHFSEPPETACTYEGASILEVIGFEEFRVRDCPMVTDDGPRFDRHGRFEE
ncbi:hypothetical protein [Halorubrum halodurans]|uniref:DUF8135 domain-containing protein n=1 Tax=Halorubrum halodurans TaxID=1383851 RepID=A0A256IPI0_9EURY|nr:hypothetical protein [Halorubrum halodurans]OYR58469.1 hypothetical protein DJ70_03150 [Halorubrum halodurans]